MDGGAWWAAVYVVTESDTTEETQQQQAIKKLSQKIGQWVIVIMGGVFCGQDLVLFKNINSGLDLAQMVKRLPTMQETWV